MATEVCLNQFEQLAACIEVRNRLVSGKGIAMRACTLVALAIAAVTQATATSYTYTFINLPGTPVGIDRAGDIAGNYTDSSVVEHGYLDTGGVVATLAAGYTVINLNQNGELLLQDPTGYATYANGKYTQLNLPVFLEPGPQPPPPFPPFTLDYEPSAINDSGQLLAVPSSGNTAYPILITGNKIQQLGMVNVFGESGLGDLGLNDSGEVAGTYFTVDHSSNPQVFASAATYNPVTGTWSIFNDPQAINSTQLTALNDSGQAVGSVDGGYPHPPSMAVTYDDGAFTMVQPPGTTCSVYLCSAAYGINDEGTIVGDTNNLGYYLATPNVPASGVPEPSVGGLSLIGLLGLVASRARSWIAHVNVRV